MYAHLGSTTELHKLIIFICFKLLKKILVCLYDEMAKNTGILFQNNDFVYDANFVFITICLNDFFPSMCDTRLISYTISFLINVEFCSIEELNVLSYFFLSKFFIHVCLSTLSRTGILWGGNGLLVVVTWPDGFSSWDSVYLLPLVGS